jgi:hypothetical protein
MPNPDPDKEKPRSLERPFWFSLLFISFVLSTTLFAISYRKYSTWYRTTPPQHRTNDLILHTTFFIATCAPLCSILGVVASATYYWRKRRKYGKYDIAMRRQGRGYCVDPSDAVDLNMIDEAKRLNAVKKGSAPKTEEEGSELSQDVLKPFSWFAGEEQRTATQQMAKRVSFFSNPYGWVRKDEGKGKDVDWGLGRSDSVRTCEDDERTKKGVADIWLGRSGTEGRTKGKARWDKKMEM